MRGKTPPEKPNAPGRSYFDKLPLPTFNGKLTEYPSFKKQF